MEELRKEFQEKDAIYEQVRADNYPKVEQEYAERQINFDAKEKLNIAETLKSLEEKQKLYGGTQKEREDAFDAFKKNREKFDSFFQGQKKAALEKIDLSAEKIAFGEVGGRLKLCEAAYGSQHPLTMQLRQTEYNRSETTKQQNQPTNERENYISAQRISPEFNRVVSPEKTRDEPDRTR